MTKLDKVVDAQEEFQQQLQQTNQQLEWLKVERMSHEKENPQPKQQLLQRNKVGISFAVYCCAPNYYVVADVC